jgi:hypothetical protein
MNLSSVTTRDEFQQKINGFYGTFITTAGHVDYLETKASLSLGPHSAETRLTKFLLPVREALPSSGMDFNQLLQRDLDDHRVATELVPYLLNPNTSGPAFFPPIVAVMLPFDGMVPKDKFDAYPATELQADSIGKWSTTTVGRSFRVDKLLTETTELHDIKLGRIHWNDECCKLVVVDGQHRAMALLAIHRTLTSTWSGAAEKYKSFYEPAVNEALSGKSEEERRRICSSVELPVTIVWFPNLHGESSSHQVAARKLFVDVNKNARKPSASRLLLLSDRDLPSIFVRESLNKFRSGSSFPIYAVEYDHPDSDEQSVSKWSVITNVGNISSCVRRLLMGPPKYFGMSSEISGRESKSELGDTLRASLDILNSLPSAEEEDGIPYKRDEIDAENFPPRRVLTLTEKYSNGWGLLIERMFLDVEPYAIHARALKELYGGWTTADAASRLAKDAIFEGVGVFWTLKEGERHWRDLNAERSLRGALPAPKTDVISSWEILTAKHQEFKKVRAKLFLGSESKERESEAAFEMYKTAACQIGLILAARALWGTTPNRAYDEIPKFINSFISAINASLKNNRQLILVKDDGVEKKRINLLDKLDASKAVHFRYLWIQLLDTNEALEILEQKGYASGLGSLVDEGRRLYRRELINNVRKALLRIDPSKSKASVERLAAKEVDKKLSVGLKKWFFLDSASYEAWLASTDQDLTAATVTNSEGDITDELTQEEISQDQPAGAEDEEIKDLIYSEKRATD